MKNLVIGHDREHNINMVYLQLIMEFGLYIAICKNDGKCYSYDIPYCYETNPGSCLTPD